MFGENKAPVVETSLGTILPICNSLPVGNFQFCLPSSRDTLLPGNVCPLWNIPERSRVCSGISVSFLSPGPLCLPLPLHPRLHTSHQTQISFWKQPKPTTDSWPGPFLTAASARNCSPSSMLNWRPQVSVEVARTRGRDHAVRRFPAFLKLGFGYDPPSLHIVQLVSARGLLHKPGVPCHGSSTPCLHQHQMAEGSKHRQ